MEIRPRESVILADDVDALVAWYEAALGFVVSRRFKDEYHYCNLESPSGIAIGIAQAAEMGVTEPDRQKNTVLLQFEVDDVQAFMRHVEAERGTILFGPSFNQKDGFWYGACTDLEGNQFWVVDQNCP